MKSSWKKVKKNWAQKIVGSLILTRTFWISFTRSLGSYSGRRSEKKTGIKKKSSDCSGHYNFGGPEHLRPLQLSRWAGAPLCLLDGGSKRKDPAAILGYILQMNMNDIHIRLIHSHSAKVFFPISRILSLSAALCLYTRCGNVSGKWNLACFSVMKFTAHHFISFKCFWMLVMQ